MNAVKFVKTNRWVWVVLVLVLAFLVYHAPRIAQSLPFI